MKKNLAFVLALLTCASVLASCISDADTQDTSDTSAAETAETTTAEAVPNYTTLPTYDLGGSDFRTAVHTAVDRPNVHVGEENGDVVNDALYARDRMIEELFNTKIVNTEFPGRNEVIPAVNKTVTAGEDAYDMILTSFQDGFNILAPNDMLADISEVDTLDFSAPYWNQNALETFSWNGKILGASGPIALCYLFSPYAMFVNLDMAEDFGIGSLYPAVNEGKWTLDLMNETMQGVSSDLDGDGEYTVNDRYGLALTLESGHAFIVGSGRKMAEKDGDEVTFLLGETKTMEVLDKLNGIFGQDSAILTDFLDNNNKEGAAHLSYKVKMFTNSQTLFNASGLQFSMISFREMEDDYGLLPFPKYNEAQEDYFSYIVTLLPAFVALPKTNTRLEETGAVMEFMCSYGDEVIRPKINEVVLKEKIARDEESKHMFDLLFANMSFDVNHAFNFAKSANAVREYAAGHTENFASKWASMEGSVMKEIETLLNNLT
nr:hypothetical protein [Clostridia bacterium]